MAVVYLFTADNEASLKRTNKKRFAADYSCLCLFRFFFSLRRHQEYIFVCLLLYVYKYLNFLLV